jgi:hypothetical protein
MQNLDFCNFGGSTRDQPRRCQVNLTQKPCASAHEKSAGADENSCTPVTFVYRKTVGQNTGADDMNKKDTRLIAAALLRLLAALLRLFDQQGESWPLWW